MIDISEAGNMDPLSPLYIPPYRRVAYRPLGQTIRSKKRLLPRLWDVVASTAGTSPRKKLRDLKFWPEFDIEAVNEWFPLDGEEGELIEDEGFLDALGGANSEPGVTSVADSQSLHESRKLDIIALLPPEIALHIFLHLDPPSLATVAVVSRYWNVFSRDMQIWRELFYRQSHWTVNPARVARQRIRMNSRASHASSTFATPAALYNRWGRNSLLSLRSVWTGEVPPFEVPPLTLALDWNDLYKTRLEIDRRWDCGEPKVNRLAGHSDR